MPTEPASSPSAKDTGPGSPTWWNRRYREGSTPWDSGIVPPELRELVESGRLEGAGVALDLGCGTGTNTLFLARLGFAAFGVDLSWLALQQARQKALEQGLPSRFCAGDVANLDYLDLQADFVLDIGCLHSLSHQDRQRYARSLARHTRSGALYLLYGFDRVPAANGGPSGFAPAEIAARFAPHFDVTWHRPSLQDERPVAWYLLTRQ